METHVLYRMFDADGALLYVGMTKGIGIRLISHEAMKPWFEQVATISIERHPTRESVAEAEAAAIRRELPIHNLVRYRGNTKVRTVRVSDEIWQDAQAQAAEDGRTMTSVINEFLVDYVDSDGDL